MLTLAKSNIINTTILDHSDLRSLLEQPTDTQIISSVEASKIKVLQSANIIYILIASPKIKFSCKKVAVHPVSHQHMVLQIDDELAECDKDILTVIDFITTTQDTFCKLVLGECCARSLHAGSTARCLTQPSHLKKD